MVGGADVARSVSGCLAVVCCSGAGGCGCCGVVSWEDTAGGDNSAVGGEGGSGVVLGAIGLAAVSPAPA